MNDAPDQNPDVDPGEPVSELASLAEEPSAGFLLGIRNSIQRRIFASDLVDLAFQASWRFLREVTDMIFSAFGPRSTDGDSTR